MKKNAFYLLLILVIIFLTSCGARFPRVENYYVTPAKWGKPSLSLLTPDGNFAILPPDGFVLSPDGKYATYPDAGFIELATGEETFPLSDYKKLNFKSEGGLELEAKKAWSPDGHYFAVYTSLYESEQAGIRNILYIYNNEDQTVKKLPDTIYNFFSWSPFNTGHFMAYFHDTPEDRLGIFDTEGVLISSLDGEVDFRNDTELRGDDKYLWSKTPDRPVAIIQTFSSSPIPTISPNFILTPPVEHAGVITGNVYIDSYAEWYTYYRKEPKYRIPIVENISINGNVGYIFDPTGKYLLLVQLQCADTNFTHCTEDYPIVNVSNVTDTVLTLLDWRTGEKQEIFRLSEIGDEHVVGFAPLAWSADGSTIIVGRYNATAVVLKIKYP